MHLMLLPAAGALALVTFAAAPATAQHFGADANTSPRFVQHGGGVRIESGFPGKHGDFDRRRHRRFNDTVVIGDWGNDAWALYNNRTFEHDSYNDWWHERPSRAYPKWVQDGKCQRLWWSGGGWRC